MSRVLCLIYIIICITNTAAQSISTLTGSQVELTCNYRVQSNGYIIWRRMHLGLVLSENTHINDGLAAEFRQRLTITGNHDNGEYNLMISDVKKIDEGSYDCYVYGDPSKQQSNQLVVIEGPTSVQVLNKQNDRLLGTEGLDLNIRCTANGGDPAPNMVLTIGFESYTSINTHTIDHTTTRVSRSYDGVTVTCQAGYDGVTFTPLTDTAVIRLDLKPLPPAFNMNPVVTEATENLVITCTSTGSRPAPSDRIWLIGNNNVDITSSSTNISLSLQPNDTYKATSTLTYKVAKDYNQQDLTCGFKNTATENNFIQITTKMNITYAPTVSVQNITFPSSLTAREIHCNIDGNPSSTFIKWQHKSKYGIVIREFDQGSTLILPEQDKEKRFQDTGEYVCITSNGIRDEHGNLNQLAAGYIVSKAPPQSPRGSYQEVLGQYRHNATLTVCVYSVPKYTTLTWLRDGDVITQSSKYTMADVPDIITDVFYGKTVHVDGFKLTLTIKQLDERDFTNYTLRLSNGIDDTLQHLIMLISASPPEAPDNLTLVSSTESSISMQWLPSFDGGHEQTFFVEYRTSAHVRWTVVEASMIVQTNTDDTMTYTLTGLQDGTYYEVRMYAENKFNRSKSTDSVKIATKDAANKSTVLGAVVGTTVSLAIIMVVVLFVIVLVIRNKKIKESSDRNMLTTNKKDENSNKEVYYNVECRTEENETGATSKTKNSEYVTLGSMDQPNKYDSLDKVQNRVHQKHDRRVKGDSNLYEEMNQKPTEIKGNGNNYEELGIRDVQSLNEYDDLNRMTSETATDLRSTYETLDKDDPTRECDEIKQDRQDNPWNLYSNTMI